MSSNTELTDGVQYVQQVLTEGPGTSLWPCLHPPAYPPKPQIIVYQLYDYDDHDDNHHDDRCYYRY